MFQRSRDERKAAIRCKVLELRKDRWRVSRLQWVRKNLFKLIKLRREYIAAIRLTNGERMRVRMVKNLKDMTPDNNV